MPVDLVSERVITANHYPDVILIHCEPKGVGPPHFAVLARNYKAVTVNKNIKLDSLCRDISIWQPLG
mgnify:FL=1